jgi:Protease subunit of ATP-dependent Clp proteases
LYGVIGTDEGCLPAAYFVEELDYAAMYFKKAEVHINSQGGDVIEGIAMIAALKSSKMSISLYVDGVAASMAAVIAFCGLPLYVNKYSRTMFHTISGVAAGNIAEMEQYIQEAKDLQNSLIDIISLRTGMLKDDVTAKWFDGKDHWLSAGDLRDLKMVDGVFDGPNIEVPESETNPSKLYNLFSNVLNPQNMEFKNFFARFKIRNTADEAEVISEVEKIEKRATDAEAENTTLKAENARLKQEKEDREKADSAAAEAEDKNTVEDAVKDGRIQAVKGGATLDEMKAHYLNMLKSNRTAGKAIINALPKGRLIKDQLKDGEESEERAKWSFKDWTQKDSAGLATMKVNDVERYKVLFKAEYGKEPKL